MSTIGYDKRDREHIREMKRYLRTNEKNYLYAGWADIMVNDAGDLTPYQRRRARQFILEDMGYLNVEDWPGIGQYIGEDVLSVEFTPFPVTGGITRKIEAGNNRPERLRADFDSIYVVVCLTYGGPAFYVRAHIEHDGRSLGAIDEMTAVYHDWGVGYEMPVEDYDVWHLLIDYLVGAMGWDEIAAELEENGYHHCAQCGEWMEDDGSPFCDECRATTCVDCYEQYDEEELFTMADGNGPYCEMCANNMGYTQCEDCSEWHTNRNMNETDDGVMLCDDCYEYWPGPAEGE